MAAAQRASAGKSGSLVEPDYRGKPVVTGFAGARGYQNFSGFRWSVLIVRDLEAAFMPVTRLRSRFLGLFALTAIITLVLAILAARHISVPIRKLTQVAGAIGEGDLEQSIQLKTSDEVGVLASTINRMTRQLKVSRDELISAKEYTESILQSLSNSVITMDLDHNVTSLNQAALDLLHMTAETAVNQPLEVLMGAGNSWVMDAVERVKTSGTIDWLVDMDLAVGGEAVSVNAAVVPLRGVDDALIGTILVMEDITTEKRIRGTMRRYMTPEVADRVLEGGEALLGGTLQTATMLFSDVRGFTTISERLGPQKTVSLLNDYLTLMVDIIFHHEGILDKYVGDAIMAVFGVPFGNERDADNAVQAAIDMVRQLGTFNERRLAGGMEPLGIGIGLNTDEVVAGNIGSPRRMDYTVIGDGVNLASRLEGANKVYGSQIIISEFTRSHLQDTYQIREVDRIRVKGKQRPVTIYEVLDYLPGETLREFPTFLQRFNEAIAAYREQQWRQAIDGFREADRLRQGDQVARTYIRRCELLQTTPPPEPWDGVWTMTEK